MNPFVTVAGLNYSYTVLKANNVSDLINSSILRQAWTYDYQGVANTYFMKELVVNNARNSPLQDRMTYGHAFKDLIPICLYQRVPCSFDAFDYYYSTAYGNCFSFNKGVNTSGAKLDLTTTTKPGLRYGLTLMLFVGNFENIYSLSFSNGAHIFIHNQTESPESASGIDISPGKYTSISISKVFNQRLPSPYNECYEDLTTPDRFDSFYYRETLKSGYTYHQTDCFKIVEQDYYIKNCHCADANIPTINGTRFCQSLTESLCLYDNGKMIYQQKLNANWAEYCPLECQNQPYVYSISTSDFPSESMASIMLNDANLLKGLVYLNKSKTIESIKSTFTYVNIFFDYTGYTLVTESPTQELVDLLSSVGGTMGLYIGISFLSFVEAVELVLLLFIKCFTFNKRHNSINEIPSNLKDNINSIS